MSTELESWVRRVTERLKTTPLQIHPGFAAIIDVAILDREAVVCADVQDRHLTLVLLPTATARAGADATISCNYSEFFDAFVMGDLQSLIDGYKAGTVLVTGNYAKLQVFWFGFFGYLPESDMADLIAMAP